MCIIAIFWPTKKNPHAWYQRNETACPYQYPGYNIAFYAVYFCLFVGIDESVSLARGNYSLNKNLTPLACDVPLVVITCTCQTPLYKLNTKCLQKKHQLNVLTLNRPLGLRCTEKKKTVQFMKALSSAKLRLQFCSEAGAILHFGFEAFVLDRTGLW